MQGIPFAVDLWDGFGEWCEGTLADGAGNELL